MKVAINKCYGGFGLSPRAVARLAELQGRKCYFSRSALIGGKLATIPATIEEIEKEGRMSFFQAYDVPVEEHPEDVSGAKWHALPDEEKETHNNWYRYHSIETRPSDRSDALLVQVIEELGQAANGPCAELAIVEIPNGVDYEIDEYDGVESIHETHRSWS